MTFIHAPAGEVLRKICRPQQTARRTVGIAVRHLKVFDDLAFIPDVISGGHHVDAQVEQFLRQRGRDSEAGRSIFAVRNDQIRGVFFAQFGQAIFYDHAPRASKDVADEKNFQDLMVSR